MKKTYSEEEQHIIDESPEISVGERHGWVGKIASAFPALKHRNYQLYFFGQMVSLIGTWMQMVAQGWLVLQLTHSAFWVGAIAAIGTAPTLILSLFGGVIIDRYSRKRIIFLTEGIAMLLAFILGFLTLTHTVTIYHIIILSFLLGVVNALDMPARLAFAVEMVGKESLSSALALNAGLFNGARVVGPAIAGATIGALGISFAFIANGMSFIAVLIALYLIKVPPQQKREHAHPLRAIKEGLTYAFTHSSIRTLLFLAGITSIFGWSYATIMPVIVKNVFNLDAAGLGYFNAVAGLGALTGTFVISAYSRKIKPIVFISSGNFIFTIALILFSFTHFLPLALLLLYFVGFGLIMQFATTNATIQHLVEDQYRGRVMSIYSLMFIGMSPLGSLQIGYLSEKLGVESAIRIGAIIVLLYGGYIFMKRKNLLSTH